MTTSPILVTGAHRSGTSWVGHILSISSGVGLIWEPFNINNPRNGRQSPFKHWFTYVTAENEGSHLGPISDVLSFRVDLVPALRAAGSPHKAALVLCGALQLANHRLQGRRPLLKDPIAVLSAEWLAQRFGARVIVMVRHPAGFVNSLKRRQWSHPFAHFLEQPLLMRDHLRDFEDEIRLYADQPQRVIDQAILLWRIIYSVVRTYKQRHPDWLFVRHEDLARDPCAGFRRLYEYLDLEFEPDVQEKIKEYTAATNPVLTERAEAIRRHSRAVVESWKTELEPGEITYIREGTRDVYPFFYSPEEW